MGSVLDQEEVLGTVAPDLVVFVGTENLALAGPKTDLPVGCLRLDEASGVDAVISHLVECGRTRIGYVSGPQVFSNTTRRKAAMRALADRGIDGRHRQYYGGGDGWMSGASVAARIAQDRPDAVLCYDDKLALAVMDGLRQIGLRVPDDIAVAGFDDIPFAALANPRLTTVAQPTAEMGRRAVQMLLSAIEGGALPPSQVLPVRLIVRESTCGGPSNASVS
jgi:LacI family repressor for deo operon, udp, cdd, tsx, nupC, and nupG